MADKVELMGELRTDLGKGASRRLRREADLVPAIVYGAGKDPVSISIPHKDLHKACESESFYSQVINITAGGATDAAILKDLQRHPAKDRIVHADFYRVRMDQEITVEVPLHFLNEEECVGVRLHDGMVSHNMSSIEISCLPGDLPEYIELDVLDLDIGDHILMSQLVLPPGLTIPVLELGEEHDQVVVTINEQRRIEDEEEQEATDAADVEASAEVKSDDAEGESEEADD
ncbi:MAG: 50S ribosomal protein L25/general stress protein Ctc [Proteobacteria bacterium]|nr:50S ribosomal protein L25/general stress protein Ctc [Pseudomonadota bacterium]